MRHARYFSRAMWSLRDMTWRILFQRICTRIPICTVRGLFLIKMTCKNMWHLIFWTGGLPTPNSISPIFDIPHCFLQMWVLQLPSSTFLRRHCTGPFEVGPTHDLAAIEVILRLTFFCPFEDHFPHTKLSTVQNQILHWKHSLDFLSDIWAWVTWGLEFSIGKVQV